MTPSSDLMVFSPCLCFTQLGKQKLDAGGINRVLRSRAPPDTAITTRSENIEARQSVYEHDAQICSSITPYAVERCGAGGR